MERRITPRTKAVCVVHYAGYPAAADRLRELCDAHGLALIEDVAHAPSATLGGRALGTWGLAGAFSFFSNKVLSVGEGGLVCTDDDEVAAFVRSRRSHAMTSGTWDRHRGRTDTYDVVGLGYNYRLDEPRAALLLSRLERLEADIARRRELALRYRALLAQIEGIIVPFEDADVPSSSCYVLPVMLERDGRQAQVSASLRELGIQTSIFYPALHRFSAYRERFPDVSLPVTELASRTELTLPFLPAHDPRRPRPRGYRARRGARAMSASGGHSSGGRPRGGRGSSRRRGRRVGGPARTPVVRAPTHVDDPQMTALPQ